MKTFFIDEENVGLKVLESYKVFCDQKLLVFTKNLAAKKLCKRYLFHCIDDYAAGSNQADFYIIACLSRLLSQMSDKQIVSHTFTLVSNDCSLISAFKQQCNLFKAHFVIEKTKSTAKTKPVNVKSSEIVLDDLAYKIISYLDTPRYFDTKFQQSLGCTQSEFTRAVTNLINQKKIERSPLAKRKWQKVLVN